MTLLSNKPEIIVVADPEELRCKAADEFTRLAEETINAKGFFVVALSGGSTPRGLYTLLATGQYMKRVPWVKVHVFWSDERCVPPDHKNSNYHMTRTLLLDRVPIPAENIYRIRAEQEDHHRAAMEYEQTMKAFFRLRTGDYPRFDLIFLGMGDDGHTASLFPSTSALEETNRLACASYVKKLGEYRLTLTVPAINHAANIVFLVSGESKSLVLREVLEGERHPQRFPSQLIRPVNGRLVFIADRLAAGKLKRFQG